MVQAERVHRTQMPLNTTIITKRNDGLCTMRSSRTKHQPGRATIQAPGASNKRRMGQPAIISSMSMVQV